MPKFEVGQKVYVSTYGRPFREATVEKVGRKYVTASGNQFVIATGVLKSGYSGQIRTESEHQELAKRSDLWSRLRLVGLEKRIGASPLTTSQLERILEIATEDQGGSVGDV